MSAPALVVPDLHGRPDLLRAVLDHFPGTHLVVLGDAIDRGARSMTVVDMLLELHAAGRATLLMGNHERMALEGLRWYRRYQGTHDMGDYRRAMEGYQWWMRAGGDTVRSELGRLTLEAFPERLETYLGLLKNTVYITGDHVIHGAPPATPSLLVSHAAPPVSHPEHRTPEDAALWLRPYEGPFPLPPGVTFSVHGHTPVQTPARVGNHLYIDMGAYETGRLAVAQATPHGLPQLTVICGRGEPGRARKYPRFGEPVPVQVIDLPGAPPR
ncbi:serine/threonine protein phosphatase 1 [Deinococcus metalli]|uniref:Phosphoprotein phosphatase n=1 Tax=Deinococcus metalli TaxID=1141878 RepID=A0A7W8KHN6_9DEIO|nr:metallophosphoesterase [Deinococcus metalli]MBB5377378.1 serine/threonine protein phosphatase 1 [Deinococcus metalli]GHF49986.1 phosphoprotein phosphatase [Deinococcus metalli]